MDLSRISQLVNDGITEGKRGNYIKAINKLSKANSLLPENPLICYNLGYAFQQTKDYVNAKKYLIKSVKLSPNDYLTLFTLGSLYQEIGLLKKALLLYRKSLRIYPLHSLCLNNIGAIYIKLDKPKNAINYLRRALALDPNLAKAHYNIASAYYINADLKNAVAHLKEAIKSNKKYIKAYNQLSSLYFEHGDVNLAINCLKVGAKNNPSESSFYINLGSIFRDTNYFDKSIHFYQLALSIMPDDIEAKANLYTQLKSVCAWKECQKLEIEVAKATIEALDKGSLPKETPFSNITRSDNPKENLAVAKSWSSIISSTAKAFNVKFEYKHLKKKPLRIGYLSADFQNHPVNHLLYPLYKNHTRPDFMIFAYSFGENDFSSYRLAVEKGCDRFFDITKLHPLKAAEKIHSDKINILVDLMGYTRNSRPNILALKPAPIQISYLGYPGTTGSDFIDYIITDPILTPTNQQKYYTEKFIYMPDCYQVNHRHAISKTKYTRKDYNLPEKGIVFASFNKTGKINPDLFKTWMNILLKVENSVLWLSLPTESQQILNNLKTYSKKYKVNVNRLIFTAKVPLEDHLKRLQLADLALDTTIYSGGVTTSNALLAGIPVLTLQGKHYLSRMSSSLIHAVGMDEMVTHSLADYENLAIKIGNDKALIQNLKQKLKQKVNKSNLYDIKSFTINIEEAYKVVWEHFAKNLPPKQFVIKAR